MTIISEHQKNLRCFIKRSAIIAFKGIKLIRNVAKSRCNLEFRSLLARKIGQEKFQCSRIFFGPSLTIMNVMKSSEKENQAFCKFLLMKIRFFPKFFAANKLRPFVSNNRFGHAAAVTANRVSHLNFASNNLIRKSLHSYKVEVCRVKSICTYALFTKNPIILIQTENFIPVQNFSFDSFVARIVLIYPKVPFERYSYF